MQRSAGGYFIMQDPLSTYYEALCTGLDWAEDFNDDPENQNLGWLVFISVMFFFNLQ